MTDKQVKQIKNQIPQGEKLDRCYAAAEGGIRVISKDSQGHETRYNVSFDADDNASIRQF